MHQRLWDLRHLFIGPIGAYFTSVCHERGRALDRKALHSNEGGKRPRALRLRRVQQSPEPRKGGIFKRGVLVALRRGENVTPLVEASAPEGWPPSLGLGGRFGSELVAAFRRNRWPPCLGFRRKAPIAAGDHLNEKAPRSSNLVRRLPRRQGRGLRAICHVGCHN
jgi:hypothetical protein